MPCCVICGATESTSWFHVNPRWLVLSSRNRNEREVLYLSREEPSAHWSHGPSVTRPLSTLHVLSLVSLGWRRDTRCVYWAEWSRRLCRLCRTRQYLSVRVRARQYCRWLWCGGLQGRPGEGWASTVRAVCLLRRAGPCIMDWVLALTQTNAILVVFQLTLH